MKAGNGNETTVIDPSQYDLGQNNEVNTIVRDPASPSKIPSPGPGWTSLISVDNCGNKHRHWMSPIRKIEFRNRSPALEFEELRKKFSNNEVRAWEEYRTMKVGADTCVVFPSQYDPGPNGKSARKRTLREEGGQAVTKSAKRQRTGLIAIDKTRNVSGKSPKASTKTQSQRNPGSKKKNAQKKRKTNSLQVEDPKKSNIWESPFNAHSTPSPENGLNCSQYKIVRLTAKKEVSFFNARFPSRVCSVESSLKDSPPEKKLILDGMKYTLASAKLVKDNQGWSKFAKEKKIELIYIQASGLQKHLEQICSFSVMRPEKVVARLAQLQSESKQVLYIDPSKIEFIKEEGHEGCGFYPEGFFDDAGGRKNYDAMQVRIIGPQVGLAKGMLLKKRGITCIQLPSSMMKAPPSKTCDGNWAAVIIKNKFPSEENNQMGRLLDPDAANATGSWMDQDRKPLSKIYKRMLIGFGVEEKVVNSYASQSKKNPKKLKHVHLKGVIDPTGKLPENKVFISGYTTDGDNNRQLFGKVHKKIYISRSPCMEPEDAKLISVVGSKPTNMSKDEWELLCSYRFGTIIFSQSRLSVPLPCVIADGDLDGDGKSN